MLDPEIIYMNDRRFLSEGEYLESLFTVLDLLMFKDPSQRMQERGLGFSQNAMTWMKLISDRLSVSEAAGDLPAMEVLLNKLHAPEYMRYLLAFLIRLSLDPSYEEKAAGENGKQALMIYDICALFAPPEYMDDIPYICQMVERGRNCLQFLFPQLAARIRRTGQSLAGLLPVMDERLLLVLLGKANSAPLPFGMQLYRPGGDIYGDEAEIEGDGSAFESTGEQEAVELLLRRRESMPPEITIIWGPEGSGKQKTAKAFSDRSGQALLFYEIPKSEKAEEGTGERLWTELSLVLRESVISGLQPVIFRAERLSEETVKEVVSWLRKQMLPRTGSIFLMMEAREKPDHLEGCCFLPMKELRGAERCRIWKECLPGNAYISSEGIDALANTFVLTRGQIRDAAAQAVRLAGSEGPVTEALLYEVCYAKLGHPLKKHTQRVNSSFAWDDLKMDPADKAILRDITSCVRYRDYVMQEWNFEQKFPYGTGTTALFCGPPGTGKTMAAQVIANELHMELYKIDLSQLIDKYVGETEKNIKRVFDEAGRSNSVLFFDEADAIFNKRIEAGNSNDRFANIESSLLLQCIEEYSGVTLLATNNMIAIDPAFMRRFRFCVQFREPGEEIRYEIWSSVFPKEAPVDPNVDFRELARLFTFTGAVIKNISLQAAYLAASTGKSIGPLEIMVAVRREMEKTHRMLSRDMMGKYEKLYPKVISWKSGNQGEKNGTDRNDYSGAGREGTGA